MTETNVMNRTETPMSTPVSEERILRPEVDIFELEDSLGVVIDMPGVQKEDVEIRIENDVLTMAAMAKSRLPGTPLYREFALGRYMRQFQLGEHVDQEKIKAEMKQGVLTVRLPKAERAKPKTVPVTVS